MSLLTVLVAVAWAANVVVGFVSPERHDPTLNAVFGIVVGGVLALRRPDPSGTPSRVRAELARLIAGDNRRPADTDTDTDKTNEPPGTGET
ncbi:MAG TPA: hypothetical protein VFW65_31955 [Pseudonocardiaceae bacterium]|nr:hypothetical protein [Pseudonocardiaceae bacterium]